MLFIIAYVVIYVIRNFTLNVIRFFTNVLKNVDNVGWPMAVETIKFCYRDNQLYQRGSGVIAVIHSHNFCICRKDVTVSRTLLRSLKIKSWNRDRCGRSGQRSRRFVYISPVIHPVFESSTKQEVMTNGNETHPIDETGNTSISAMYTVACN